MNNLEWVTSKENKAHTIEQGRFCVGENHPNHKLTEEQVKEIRKMKGLKSESKIAEIFNVSPSTINVIIKNKQWKWL